MMQQNYLYDAGAGGIYTAFFSFQMMKHDLLLCSISPDEQVRVVDHEGNAC
jgi:hypothetical protein